MYQALPFTRNGTGNVGMTICSLASRMGAFGDDRNVDNVKSEKSIMKHTKNSEIIRKQVLNDRRTGREIWKITPDGAGYLADYMYKINFTPDEKYLDLQSNRGGGWQTYRYTLASGELVQLTDSPVDPDATAPGKAALRCANINPVTYELFYIQGTAIHAVHLESLEDRVIVNCRDMAGFRKLNGSLHFSHDGRFLVVAYDTVQEKVGILRVDCRSGAAETVYVRPENSMQHLQYVHSGYDLLSFSAAPDYQQEWDAPPQKRARTYLLDLTVGEEKPLLVMPPPCTATHEYWGPTGDRIYYHKKTRPTWTPTWLCVLDRHTMQEREIFRTDEFKLGHSFVDKDETFIVTDVQNPNDNPLIKVDIATGKPEILCWPDSTLTDSKLGHVHPSISPQGSYVLYTTDKSGESQVYLVPLKA